MNLKSRAEQFQAYRDWYGKAEHRIADLSTELEQPYERVAAVLAITSPRVHVKRNWTLATDYLSGRNMLNRLPNVSASLDIYEETGYIGGQKVRAFYRALTGDPDAVVLDVWMAKLFDVDPMKLRNKSVYEPLTTKVVGTARRMGWEPRQVQAALWAYTMTQSGHNVPNYGEFNGRA
jgi:hypothetical protein